MTELTGTPSLVRAILRRDRVRILVWLVAIVALTLSTAASVKSLYPTQADLERAAVLIEDNAAAIIFNGPAQGLDSLGGRIAFETGTTVLVVIGLMTLLMMSRNTRAEEESGRIELVRATVVGRHAPMAAALIVVSGMNVLIGALVTLGLLGQDLPTTGCVVFGASFAVFGVVFAGVTAVAAQITENTRVASGSAGAVLGAAFVLRAAGDVGDGTLSWLSPIGWVQKARPFAGGKWWPLLLALGGAAVLVAVAVELAAHRDVGAGLVPPRPGPPRASPALGRAAGLALRLQRGSLVAWSVGVFVLGLAYGSVADDIDDFVADNEALEDILTRAGGANLVDAFFGTTLLILALVGAGFAVQATARLRSEETSSRVEPLLATPVSRTEWLASHLQVALAGSAAVLVAGGLGLAVGYGAVSGNVGDAATLVVDAIVYIPAVWTLIALTMAIIGLAPRAVAAGWAALGVCFTIGLLGEVLDVPTWLRDLSPFEQTPQLPAADLAVAPLVALLLVALGLGAAGTVGFRRRDIG